MTQGTTDPRLALKATAPKASKFLLPRARLRLDSGAQVDRSVIAVQAPPGYGKTSLLTQWRREALEAGAIVAWLSLDSHDDNAQFIRGLGVALKIGSGSGTYGSRSADTISGDSNGMDALTVWLADVADMAVEIVLILDDAHALPEATINVALSYLMLNAPPNLQVIVAFRRPIPIKIADLLASGRFLLLDVVQLRLTLDETTAILTSRFGTRIDQELCVRLHDLTEGWPLGLQLAASTIQGSADLHDAVNELSSFTGDLQRYFVECLVDRLPDQAAQFLVCISCLDLIEHKLCRYVTGLASSAESLSYLSEATPIFQNAGTSNWMRLHPLAREFLYDRFLRLPEPEQRELHSRAAHWLTEHDMPEEAARHAFLANELTFAYDLVERCLYDIIRRGQVAEGLGLIERLPAEEIERRIELRIAVGWVLAQSARHTDAKLLVASIIDDPTAGISLRCEAAEICATAALFADDFDELERLVSPWLGKLSQLPPLQQIAGTNLHGMLLTLQGKPEQARFLFDQLPKAPRVMELGYAVGWSGWVAGFSYFWEGQVVLAEEVLRPALVQAEAVAGRRSPIAALLAATLAAVLWERDEADEAGTLLAARLDIIDRHAPPDAIIHAYFAAARHAAAQKQEPRAIDLLENLRALGHARDLPRLEIASLTEQIRMNALKSRHQATATLLAQLEALPWIADDRQGVHKPIVRTQVALARAWHAFARTDYEHVLEHLDGIDTRLRHDRRTRDAIQVQLMRAYALKQCNEGGEPLFREAVGTAESLGLRRLLPDTHPRLIEWARQLCADSEAPFEPPPVAPVSAGQTPVIATVPRISPSVLLTPKEREVLRLLAGNLSNKQIANALGVGDQTIKWHLKNLFGKLSVGTRQHLLGRARMLGILE